jgi:hypothetical protein
MHDLRDALHEAAPSPRGSLDLEEAVRRGRVLAWQRRAAAAALTLITLTAVWIVSTSLPLAGQHKRPLPADTPPVPSQQMSCSDEGLIRKVQGASGTIVTAAPDSLLEVASGERQDREWSLCAYVEKIKKQNQPPEDHLCVAAKFGSGPPPAYACSDLGAPSESPGSDYLLEASGVVNKGSGALYYGVVSHRVSRVVLRPKSGTESEARIFEPHENLGVDYKFFVGFAPPNMDVTVSVEDGAGRELDKHVWKAEP